MITISLQAVLWSASSARLPFIADSFAQAGSAEVLFQCNISFYYKKVNFDSLSLLNMTLPSRLFIKVKPLPLFHE